MWQRNRDFDFHKVLRGYKHEKQLPLKLEPDENPQPEPLTYLEKLQIREEQIKHENFLFGQRLLQTTSKLDTWQKKHETTLDNYEKKVKEEIDKVNKTNAVPRKSVYPEIDIMRKYHFNARNDLIVKYKPFHPKVYMELECKNGPTIGRIIFQLYTESCPDIVEEFLHIFMQRAKYKLCFGRLYPMQFLDCDVKMNSLKNLKKQILPCNRNAIDQCTDIGILSFNDRFLSDFNNGKFSFSINFRCLHDLQSRQIAFGRTVMGLRLVEMLSHFGNNSGIPHKRIVVKDIGVEK